MDYDRYEYTKTNRKYATWAAAQAAALEHARGTYQRRLVLGYASWSGSDLAGAAARDHWGSYAASRDALGQRLRAARIPHAWYWGAGRSNVEIWGSNAIAACERAWQRVRVFEASAPPKTRQGKAAYACRVLISAIAAARGDLRTPAVVAARQALIEATTPRRRSQHPDNRAVVLEMER